MHSTGTLLKCPTASALNRTTRPCIVRGSCQCSPYRSQRHMLQNATTQSISGAAPARPWLPLNAPLLWEGTEEEALSNPKFRNLPPAWKVMLLSDGSVTRHLQLLTGWQPTVDCLEMAEIGDSTAGLPPAASLITGPRVQRKVLLRTPTHHNQLQNHTVTQSHLNGNQQAVQVDKTQHTPPSEVPPQHTPSSSSSSQTQTQTAGRLASSISMSSVSQQAPLVYAVSWWNAAQVKQYLSDTSQPIWVSLSQSHVELYRQVLIVHHGNSPELEPLLGHPGPYWGRQYFFWHQGKPLTLIYEVFSPELQAYLGKLPT